MDKGRLYQSSRKHMNRALNSWIVSEDDMTVLHAGIAVEHLLKSFLASKHPSLLVEGRDFNSLLHAVGEGAQAAVDEYHAKSLGAVECYRRVTRFINIPITESQAEPIFNARNGVAHMGLHQSGETRRVLGLAVRIIERVLDGIGVEHEAYWGEFACEFNGMKVGPQDLDGFRDCWRGKEQERRDREKVVAAKIFHAKVVYRVYGRASEFLEFKRFPEQQPLAFRAWIRAQESSSSTSRISREDYDEYCKKWFKQYRIEGDEVRIKVLTLLQGLPDHDREPPLFDTRRFNVPDRFEEMGIVSNERWVDCPVCGFTMALLREQGRCYVGPVDWPAAYEEDYVEVWKVIQPEQLDCAVCLLRLDNNAELEAVGLDQAWNEEGPVEHR